MMSTKDASPIASCSETFERPVHDLGLSCMQKGELRIHHFREYLVFFFMCIRTGYPIVWTRFPDFAVDLLLSCAERLTVRGVLRTILAG